MRRFPVSLFSLACTLSAALCQDLPEPDKEPSGEGVEKTAQSVEELARLARRSAVVIRHGGRTGGEGGTGSGSVGGCPNGLLSHSSATVVARTPSCCITSLIMACCALIAACCALIVASTSMLT